MNPMRLYTMTTHLQTKRRLISALFLIIGLVISSSSAFAQSRGSTEGRKSRTERTEKKQTTSSKAKSSSQSQGRTQSRSTRQSSQRRPEATRSSGQRSGAGTSRSTRSQPAQRSTNSSSRQSGNSRASTSRSGRSAESTQRSTRSTGTRSTNDARNSNDRSTDSRASSNRNTERGSDARRGSSRNTRTETRRTDDRDQNGTRGSMQRSTRTRTDTRNTGDAQRENARSDNDSRGNRTRNTSDARQRSNNSRGSSSARGATNRGSRGVSNDTRRQSTRGRTTDRGTVRVDGRRNGTRRDATRVGTRIAIDYGWRNTRQHRNYKYGKGHWRYKSNRVYVNPVYRYRPHVQVNVVWPWQNRYRRHWRPSYRYCQVVYVESGRRGRYHRAKIDIRTNYHHEVRYADQHKAVVDIYLDEIEVYEDGYYLGKVRRFPRDLEHIEATIYRNGDVVYDRNVFIVGDPHVGFEMISTRHYDGYVMEYYDRSHGMEVGRLNFRRKRVDARRYSRLFDPYEYNSYAPISLLPDDQQLLDYGYDAISYHYYDDNYDPYYGGTYADDYYDYDQYGNYSIYEAPRRSTSGSYSHLYGNNQLSGNNFVTQAQPLTLNRSNEYKAKHGGIVKIQREATLERIK